MNPDQPLVSAVVTTYERPQQVRRAIESVLAQTYENLELIVVEDGSDSGVDEWLVEQGHDEVTCVRHDRNRGLAAARNTGIDHTDGEYVALLDDDDEWKPTRVEAQVERLEEAPIPENLGVVYCPVEVRSTDGVTKNTIHPRNEGNLREAIKAEGALTLSSTGLFSREALETVGGFDESLPSGVDHDIWMSLAVHDYAAVAIDEPLVISYDTDEPDMMNDTAARIYGVERYVEKWTPTYQDWFGSEAGKAYAREYFADVIGRLTATKVGARQWSEAGQAVCALLNNCRKSQVLRVLWWRVVVSGTMARLPGQVADAASRFYRVLRN